MVIFQEKHRKKPAGEILMDYAHVIRGTGIRGLMANCPKVTSSY